MIDRRCPYCEKDAQVRISRLTRQPRSGDVSVCSKCFGWSVYGHDLDGMYLRTPGPHEVRYWEQHADLLELLVAVQIHQDVREAIAWWEAIA
jgi:hypothetical protein